MLNKLMVCLDGSALAEEIIPVVTDIAKCFAGTVVLFQAIDEPTTYITSSLPAGDQGRINQSSCGEIGNLASIEENRLQPVVNEMMNAETQHRKDDDMRKHGYRPIRPKSKRKQ